jgi:predicted TIM-barrel fold metal-dependent hydrolase
VLETSACNPQDIGRAIKEVGADRILFGSDLLTNIGVELAKYDSLQLSESELKAVLSENAIAVYKLRGVATPVPDRQSVKAGAGS